MIFFLCFFFRVCWVLPFIFLLEQRVQCVAYPVFIHTCCHIVGGFFHLVLALPMATPMPAWRMMGMSLPPSPKAMVSSTLNPSWAAMAMSALPLSAPMFVMSVKAGCQRELTQWGNPFITSFSCASSKKGLTWSIGLHDNLQRREIEIEVQSLAELLCQSVRVVDNSDMLSAHDDRRLMPSVCRFEDLLHRGLVNLMAIEPVFSYDAQGTRRRDVAVNEGLYLTEVIDEQEWAPRGDVDLEAVGLRLSERVYGRLGYLVCLKTDERAVNIEK